MTNSQEKEIYQLDLPVDIDVATVVSWLRLKNPSPRIQEMAQELTETAKKLAHPRAIYRISHSHVIDNTTTDIDGIVFTSRVLSKLLAGRDMVIPFIVTIGKELDEFTTERSDMMRGICLEVIKTLALHNAFIYLEEYLKKKYNMPQSARMRPGAVEDWHIAEQRPLFSLFDSVEERIGVDLPP